MPRPPASAAFGSGSRAAVLRIGRGTASSSGQVQPDASSGHHKGAGALHEGALSPHAPLNPLSRLPAAGGPAHTRSPPNQTQGLYICPCCLLRSTGGGAEAWALGWRSRLTVRSPSPVGPCRALPARSEHPDLLRRPLQCADSGSAPRISPLDEAGPPAAAGQLPWKQ